MRVRTLALPCLALFLVACGATSTNTSGTSGSDTYASETGISSSNMTQSLSASNNAAWDGTLLSGKHVVVLKTDKGDITLELDADAAPKTVTNFVTLAKAGFYNGLTFHRVIPGFMIQGGDPNGNGTGGGSIYGPTFADEIDPASPLYQRGYKAGVIAMANRGVDTNGSQFFIMDNDYPLSANYTIFGHVIKGQDVVGTIANVPADPANNMPKSPVKFSVDVQN